MQKTKERDSNLELYRIIVMLLIVAHHYVVNSGLTDATGPIYSNVLSIRSMFLLIFGAWGKTGINCFVLITGYFMCKSNITLKKFLKLLFEIWFYRIIINLVFWITSYNQVTLTGIINIILPVRSIATGFSPAYLVFFLFIPFLNILINNITEKQHLLLLLLLSFTYIFLGTFPYFSVNMNYVSWFMVLYFMASYIRNYPKRIFENVKLWKWLTLIFVIISILSVIACAFLSHWFNKRMAYYFVQDSNTLLAVLVGVSSFLTFKNLKIKNSKFINKISSTCFGVLLIHANSDVMRKWLWKDVLNNVGMYNSPFLVVHAVLSVLIIFIFCSMIDLLRIRYVEKPLFVLWDKKYDKILKNFSDIESKIFQRLHIKNN